MGHAIGDWDGDGYLDWFSTAMWQNISECSMSGCTFVGSGNLLYRNRGGRQFEDATDQVYTNFLYKRSPVEKRQGRHLREAVVYETTINAEFDYGK